MVSGTIINKIPEGLGLIGILIIDAPVDLLFQDRGRAGSAIIEEEVITIYPVLRPVIDKQGVPYMLFLFLGEVQYLLRNIAAPHLVLDHIVLEIGHSQFIIRLSFGESIDKIRFGEIKYTVIEYIIYICLGSYMRRAACPYTVNTSSSYGALVIRLIRASSLSLGCAIADRERIPSRNRNMLFVILFLII